jgi:hypothetical protein
MRADTAWNMSACYFYFVLNIIRRAQVETEKMFQKSIHKSHVKESFAKEPRMYERWKEN